MKKETVLSEASPMSGTLPDVPAGSTSRVLVVLAFLAIYFIWGSTYLGIRFAIETMPPFLMGGMRYVLAGVILFGAMLLRGSPCPGWIHWRNALVTGSLMLGIGNGAVNWAQQWVPSNVTALIIAATPGWFVLLDWLRPGGVRPSRKTLIGITVGFFGMIWLVMARDSEGGQAIAWLPALVLLLACFSWTLGSLYARYTPKPESVLMGIALQMLVGGFMLSVAGWMAGETRDFHFADVSTRSWIAFFYLTLVGALVGFTAYSWLLKVSTPEKVSTHTFVNPVIAVLLGWMLAGESLTMGSLIAAGLIVVGVMIITTRRWPLMGKKG